MNVVLRCPIVPKSARNGSLISQLILLSARSASISLCSCDTPNHFPARYATYSCLRLNYTLPFNSTRFSLSCLVPAISSANPRLRCNVRRFGTDGASTLHMTQAAFLLPLNCPCLMSCCRRSGHRPSPSFDNRLRYSSFPQSKNGTSLPLQRLCLFHLRRIP